MRLIETWLPLVVVVRERESRAVDWVQLVQGLERRGTRGGLSGEGRLSTSIAGERVVDVNVSSAAATRFLTAVAGASVVPGPYQAMLDHTDDYPHIEIAFHVDVRDIGESSGLALLFTGSQGEFHAPWGACLGGEMFCLPGEEIGKALAALRSPLKRATLDRMMKETGRRKPRADSRTRP